MEPWRIGLIVVLCLALVHCEEDEPLKCTGGECVKPIDCVSGELEANGTDVIDIRFNPENECVDFLLKCCPYPEDEYDDDGDVVNQPMPFKSSRLVVTPATATVPEPMNAQLIPIAQKTISAPSNTETIKNGSQKPLDQTVNKSQECGLRNVGGVGFRITGDSDGESEYGEFPWMTAIFKEQKALDRVVIVYICGGSLIHPSVVLTAAHYVRNEKPGDLKIRLGEWDTQSTNEVYPAQDRKVVEIVTHADFNKGSLFNDVALLFLDKPAELRETVNTICLPPGNFNFDRSRCFASGWGKDVFGKDGQYSVILKKTELPIMPRGQCQRVLRTTRLGRRFKLHTSFICAGGEKGRDTCKGDGGSPLVCPIPGTINRYYQAGMVAWGIGCGDDGIPGVYVNVQMFRDWIDDHLRQRNLSNDYYQFT